jgi:hypothetical protein
MNRLKGQSSPFRSVPPTLLAQIWSELGEAEQGRVEQVILDYAEAQRDVEVE